MEIALEIVKLRKLLQIEKRVDEREKLNEKIDELIKKQKLIEIELQKEE